MTFLNAVQKLISLHKNQTNLKKSEAKDATAPSPKMTQFCDTLDDIVDITRRKDLSADKNKRLKLFFH